MRSTWSAYLAYLAYLGRQTDSWGRYNGGDLISLKYRSCWSETSDKPVMNSSQSLLPTKPNHTSFPPISIWRFFIELLCLKFFDFCDQAESENHHQNQMPIDQISSIMRSDVKWWRWRNESYKGSEGGGEMMNLRPILMRLFGFWGSFCPVWSWFLNLSIGTLNCA